jgi:uncharacterized membrane protein YuzA (DUF378 family)
MKLSHILKAIVIVVIGFIILSIGVVIIPIILGLGAIWIITLMFTMEEEEEEEEEESSK